MMRVYFDEAIEADYSGLVLRVIVLRLFVNYSVCGENMGYRKIVETLYDEFEPKS